MALEAVRGLTGEKGHRFTVLLPAEGPIHDALGAVGGVRLLPSDLPWWLAPGDPAPADLARGLASTLAAAETLRHDPPDVVLSVTSVIPWGALLAHLLGRPHVWYLTDFGERALPGWRTAVAGEALVEALGAADGLFIVSRAVGQWFFGDGYSRAQVLYPFVDVPAPAAGAARQATAGGGVTRFGVFGAIQPEKNAGAVVRAVAALAADGQEVELVVAGQPVGDYPRRLEELAAELGIAERVRVLGFADDLYATMSEVDVVVVPSRLESFSLVALEALLLGCPVVAAAVGGIPEFVADGCHGRLYPPGEQEALERAMEEVAGDLVTMKRRVAEARAELAERFSRERFVSTLDAGLRQAMVRRERPALAPALAEVLAAGLRWGLARDADVRRLEAMAVRERESWREEVEGLATERARLGREVQELARSGAEAAACREAAEAARDAAQRRSAEAERGREAALTGLAEAEQERAEAEQERAEAEQGRADAEAELGRVAATRAWRWAVAYWRALDRLLPPGSRRRRLYARLLG